MDYLHMYQYTVGAFIATTPFWVHCVVPEDRWLRPEQRRLLEDLIKSLSEEMGFKKPPLLKECPLLGKLFHQAVVMALGGCYSPFGEAIVIANPSDFSRNMDQDGFKKILPHIIRHELTHIRHHDSLQKMLVMGRVFFSSRMVMSQLFPGAHSWICEKVVDALSLCLSAVAVLKFSRFCEKRADIEGAHLCAIETLQAVELAVCDGDYFHPSAKETREYIREIREVKEWEDREYTLARRECVMGNPARWNAYYHSNKQQASRVDWKVRALFSLLLPLELTYAKICQNFLVPEIREDFGRLVARFSRS